MANKKRLRRGLWSPEEDEKLMNHIAKYGHGCWSSVPRQAGLERCGKSCRLRWINYLRPDLKRGTFSQEEEELIIQLHSVLGNKWSQIAARLPGRTDNEVKNYWNSYIKKKLRERGIDPATHKPLAEASTNMKSAGPVVFSHAELIMSPLPAPPTPMLDKYCSDGSSLQGLGLDRPVTSNEISVSGWHTSNFMAYFDMDTVNCGAMSAVVPSVSSSSTVNSMGLSPATDEPSNIENTGFELQSSSLTWLELGQSTDGHVELDGALDALKWSDYFDGSFQLAANQNQGQCTYDDIKETVQYDIHGLSNWC